MARPVRHLSITFIVSCVVSAMLFTSTAQALVDSNLAPSGTQVVVWGVPIMSVRADYHAMSTKERAAIAERQIRAIPISGDYKIDLIEATEGAYTGAWVRVNEKRVFGFLEGDVPPGMSVQAYGEQVMAQLRIWLERRHAQQTPVIILYGALYSVLASVVFVGGILLAWRSHGVLLRRVHALSIAAGARQRTKLAGVYLMPFFLSTLSGLLRLLILAVLALMSYLWITFVLRQFPYSKGLGDSLADYILSLLGTVASAIVASIPDLIMICVVFWITSMLVSALKSIFLRIEKGRLQSQMFDAETAKATRRLIVILIWIFAVIVVYPYIPGSDTDAFKGVSVFLGLMVSLGSAGFISQLLGGLIVVYSRAFQPGDFVKIAEHDGTITALGVLSTKIRTLRNEEISVPNAILLGATTINYSKLSRDLGLVIATTVTIGYDTPWRQVHELLLKAARRCEQISEQPEPFVLQTALNDWYVEYRLQVTIHEPTLKFRILSQLHQGIQDEFAAAGVQIMSPHFVAQPEQPVLPQAVNN